MSLVGFDTADAWVTSTVATAVELCPIHGDVTAEVSAYETFDRGWGPEGEAQFLVDALDEVEALPAESMNAWVLNQLLMSLPGSVAAAFDASSTVVESFAVWATPEDYQYDIWDLESRIFDGQPHETFEWHPRWIVFGSGSVCPFGTSYDGTTETAERFYVVPAQWVAVSEDKQSLERVDGKTFEGFPDDIIFFETAGKVPAPALSGDPYFTVVITGSSAQISTVRWGEPITFTDVGTGDHKIVATGTRCWTYEIT